MKKNITTNQITTNQIGPFVFLVIIETEEKHPWLNQAVQYTSSGNDSFVLEDENHNTVYENKSLPNLGKYNYWSHSVITGTRYDFRFLIIPASYAIYSEKSFPK